ncbi:MAG TPA: SdrD B-like domain-containing protein [Propionibacteriaceae bacterium]
MHGTSKDALGWSRLIAPRRVVVASLLTVLAASWSATPQPAAAATSVSGVVNTYQAVGSIAGSVISLTGSTTGASESWRTGDQVLLMQMTGVNPAARASGLGSYERAVIASVSEKTVSLTRAPVRTYSPGSERVQLVRMVSDAGTTTVSGTVTARPWDGRTGGVVAMTGGNLNLGGRAIDVSGDGFTNTNAPFTSSISGNLVSIGSTVGRGLGAVNGGGGGGGRGGAGGAGSGWSNSGGSTGGGGDPGQGASAAGTDGGRGAPLPVLRSKVGGSGGGGGVIGGGGGGGGGDGSITSPGGGGGVAGGGGGGRGGLLGSSLSGAGGGGVGGVGNGGDGLSGSILSGYGSAGGGGGSYGGGGASGGIRGSESEGSGGGGGGGWFGGGPGGYGKHLDRNSLGGAGNTPVDTTIPDADHYLNEDNPRLMMGGSGGRGSADFGAVAGGAGGGVVYLDYTSITGGGSVRADGGPGLTPGGGIHSGSGGGAGGQVRVIGSGRGLDVTANGADGGRPSTTWLGAGAGGGGGGAGGVWLERLGAPRTCGTSAAVSGVQASVRGGGSPRVANPRGGAPTVEGGTGGLGLVCSSSPPTFAIGDRVWRDLDANGVLAPGEPGLPSVSVALLDSSDATVATTTTGTSGRYVFDGLLPGTYRVRFTLPGECAFSPAQAAGSTPASDSDPRPTTGLTAAIPVGPDQPDQRAVTPADGTLAAGQINPEVDAGIVCSTSSETELGGYGSGPILDLLPATAGPFDSATGVGVMSAAGDSSTFLLQVDGIADSASATTYGAHLNFGPCVAGNGPAAGGRYNTDVLDGELPAEVSPRTEVWLALTPDARGFASASATVPFVPTSAERSLVIYSAATNPDTGSSGPRQSCLPFVVR